MDGRCGSFLVQTWIEGLRLKALLGEWDSIGNLAFQKFSGREPRPQASDLGRLEGFKYFNAMHLPLLGGGGIQMFKSESLQCKVM